jgi:GeoRSP system SPASM domain protein
MNLTELSSPIRMYWDVGPAGNIPEAEYRRVAEEIAANKFLSLQITERNDHLSPVLWTILESLKDTMIALSLVASHTALDRAAIDRLGKLPIKVLFLEAGAVNELDRVLALSGRTKGRPAIGIAYAVTRDNFRELPELLSFCNKHHIEHLLLPMQRLTESTACFTFTKEERALLASRLDAMEKPSWLKVTIHDPFLWRAFYPTVEFPNGGCQAANTMLYISPDLDVFPCPMLPIKIGNLLNTSLNIIMRSELKKGLRRDILKRPAVCTSCGEAGACKGGCRGRAFFMTGSIEQPDPACA